MQTITPLSMSASVTVRNTLQATVDGEMRLTCSYSASGGGLVRRGGAQARAMNSARSVRSAQSSSASCSGVDLV